MEVVTPVYPRVLRFPGTKSSPRSIHQNTRTFRGSFTLYGQQRHAVVPLPAQVYYTFFHALVGLHMPNTLKNAANKISLGYN